MNLALNLTRFSGGAVRYLNELPDLPNLNKPNSRLNRSIDYTFRDLKSGMGVHRERNSGSAKSL